MALSLATMLSKVMKVEANARAMGAVGLTMRIVEVKIGARAVKVIGTTMKIVGTVGATTRASSIIKATVALTFSC